MKQAPWTPNFQFQAKGLVDCTTKINAWKP